MKPTPEQLLQPRYEVIADYPNSPFTIGEIVKDHIGALRIEMIQVRLGFNEIPECYYTGTDLNKDGTPAKKQTRARGVSE